MSGVILGLACAPLATAQPSEDIAAAAAAEATSPPECRPRDVIRGHLNGIAAAAERCPLPSLETLLSERVAEAIENRESEYTPLKTALKQLAAAARSEASWGQDFSRRLDLLLSGHVEGGCKHVQDVPFTAVQPPLPALDDCECTFLTGHQGDPAFACFRFPDGEQPLPPCKVRGLAVYDFPDWDRIARAYRFHTAARGAFQRLDATCPKLALQRLELAKNRWTALRKYGYVQYPWELAVSRLFSNRYRNYSACFETDTSCTGEEGLDPERVRLIFLHPGVGLGFPGFGFADASRPSARANITFVVEALGITWYPTSFTWYWGLSLGAGFQDLDFSDPRIGPFVHLTRWLQLGYLVSLRRDTRLDATLYVGLDFLGWTYRALSTDE